MGKPYATRKFDGEKLEDPVERGADTDSLTRQRNADAIRGHLGFSDGTLLYNDEGECVHFTVVDYGFVFDGNDVFKGYKPY
ncbi:hypothetical protein H4R18_003347 [Coemansia javaensis]|uniref:Uncharacterized protein n=1 Tax=Coemansia javaensis TaxID=2761396 RepID=A0A9W8HCE0_9FUNG|nr:hypothetical protein H4R18_003347 [Coemansia javaensis]